MLSSVKTAGETSDGDVASGWTFGGLSEELRRLEDSRAHLRGTVGAMASEAGFGGQGHAGFAACKLKSEGDAEAYVTPGAGSADVNKDGGACPRITAVTASSVKTPKYDGKVSWEAFHAQFELLAKSQNWSQETKALQLAMCLTDEALACLLLLDAEDRQSYVALVGALQRRFGNFTGAELLRNELNNRYRRHGEPLRQLANDIESLTRRAYSSMPPAVQSELARDRFMQALSPPELRVEVQLTHPQSLSEALERASERETARAYVMMPTPEHNSPHVRAAAEVPRTARLCWGCGKPGHLVRSCPKTPRHQGNDSGSV